MVPDKSTQKILLDIQKKNQIYLEGNILKVLESDNEEFNEYLNVASVKDKESRRKRLDITKQIQAQNKELTKWKDENTRLMEELQSALHNTQSQMKTAKEDLELLQRKTQFELINLIVKVALWMIIGVGATTSVLYGLVLWKELDSTLIESTWSNMFSILLTNSFSIIGTIMGVKYVTNQKGEYRGGIFYIYL
jgi:ElaB/YqjD/DUF883 family membrane-anchored ribosome-binding protein